MHTFGQKVKKENGGPPRGGEVLFAVKTMFIHYKNDSDAYNNTTLLCGKEDFAATSKPLNIKKENSAENGEDFDRKRGEFPPKRNKLHAESKEKETHAFL